MLGKLNKPIFVLITLLVSLNIFGNESLQPKKEYSLVISEIVKILDKNHFKKDIEITKKKVINNLSLIHI